MGYFLNFQAWQNPSKTLLLSFASVMYIVKIVYCVEYQNIRWKLNFIHLLLVEASELCYECSMKAKKYPIWTRIYRRDYHELVQLSAEVNNAIKASVGSFLSVPHRPIMCFQIYPSLERDHQSDAESLLSVCEKAFVWNKNVVYEEKIFLSYDCSTMMIHCVEIFVKTVIE